METATKTENAIQWKLELPEDLSRPEKVKGDADGITINNDTRQGATVFVHNELLGPASLGHVAAGQQVVLPCAWAWWDVYVLFDGPAEWFLRWVTVGKVIYHPSTKSKNRVGYRDTVNLSQL